MGLIKCPDCGKEISDKSLYCLNCGCPVKQGEAPKKPQPSCPNCGNPMERGNTVCSECGARLVSVNGAPVNGTPTHVGKISVAPVKRESNNSKKTGEGLAITAMVCGIVGLATSYMYIGIVPSILGICFSITVLFMKCSKKGMAIAGLITSILGIIVFCQVVNNSDFSNVPERNLGVQTEEQQNVREKDESLLEDSEEKKISIEPTEIYNGNGVSIEISEIEQSRSETTISFLLTSVSDKDYAISAHTYAVNGLMAGEHLYGSDVDLPAGKKAKFSVEIKNQWLAENGIEKIAQLDFLFWAYGDSVKEWDTGNIELKTNLYDEGLMYSPSGEEIYTDPNITVWYTGNVGEDYSFVIKNNNYYNSDYTIDNCSVNDWSYKVLDYTYDLFDEPIHANSYDVFTLSVESGFMEEYDISQIESIEFSITLGNKTTEKIKITN